ncbi:ATP-grasp domain-containing protein [Caballeronia insecticola]|uniref:ATP-grasp domain-containing protein n=1 Tax=Caballeronia insecticola TaxID=758793 RepID=UPI0005C6F11E|nr:ATP-grasp domain-containing protein [Caballeronia insecticola]
MTLNCILFIEASITGAGEVACAHAKRAGLIVVLMSADPQRYGERILAHCDIVRVVDTTSAAALIAHADIVARKHSIVGVVTTSDFHVVQTATLAAQLDLPGNSPDVVDTIKDKFKMREAIARIAPGLNPAYTQAHTVDDALQFGASAGYPLVAKPLTGNDSLYVKLIEHPDALHAYFDARKRWGRDVSGQEFAHGVLLEEAIGGDEYCLDLLRAPGGNLISIGAFSKKISGRDIGHFIKIGASFPADLRNTEQLVDAIAPVVDALGFEVGAINIDCKIVDGDQVKILEMNPRLVGDQMGSHMIEIATGQNPAHAIVDVACGLPLLWQPTRSRGVAIHRLTMPRSGYFDGISNGAELAAHDGVEFVNELRARGQWIETAESNQGVVGSIIVSQPSANEAMTLATRLAADAKIRVTL